MNEILYLFSASRKGYLKVVKILLYHGGSVSPRGAVAMSPSWDCCNYMPAARGGLVADDDASGVGCKEIRRASSWMKNRGLKFVGRFHM